MKLLYHTGCVRQTRKTHRFAEQHEILFYYELLRVKIFVSVQWCWNDSETSLQSKNSIETSRHL